MLTGRVGFLPFVASKVAARVKHHVIASLLAKVTPQVAAKQPGHYLTTLSIEEFIQGSSQAFQFLNRHLAATSREDLKDVVSSTIWKSIETAELSDSTVEAKDLNFVNVTACIVDGKLPEMFRVPQEERYVGQDESSPEFPADQTVSITVRFHSEVALGENPEILHRRIDELEFSSRVDTDVTQWKITAIN